MLAGGNLGWLCFIEGRCETFHHLPRLLATLARDRDHHLPELVDSVCGWNSDREPDGQGR